MNKDRRDIVKIMLAVAMAVTPVQATAPTLAEIDHATTVIASRVTTSGTAYGWDPAAKRVVVTVDSTVTGDALAVVEDAVRDAGRGARLERVPGKLRLLIAGGDGIYSGTQRCTLGFNAHYGRFPVFITAGHCLAGTQGWYANGVLLGQHIHSSFPGDDYGIVFYTNRDVEHPSAVVTPLGLRPINGWSLPPIGSAVCMAGRVSGWHCGTIQSLNNTVTFPGGTVYGLIRTNICAEPGDSGAPLIAGDRVIGILVGGSGNCSLGGSSYFQPIGEIVNRYGLTIP